MRGQFAEELEEKGFVNAAGVLEDSLIDSLLLRAHGCLFPQSAD